MGKFEKKRTRQASNNWNLAGDNQDYDNYNLDNLRQFHEGGSGNGGVYESSSVRRGQSSYQETGAASGSGSGSRRSSSSGSRGQGPRRDYGDYDAPQQSAYSQSAYSQPATPRRAAPRRPRKKHRVLRFFLHLPITLLGLVILAILASILLAKMPQTDQPLGPRKDGCCTILLCGTDLEGTRTDTMLLLYLDRNQKTTRLLSLPRDTMVNRESSVPKLNGAYGANGAGEQGMNELLNYVKDLVGYRPDAYLLLELDFFSELVDAMGGVTFDVPMDMTYDDPSQDLYIDLKAGLQHLDGKAAMELVRFRSGYAMADLERVKVQRDFLKAAISQWKSIVRLPRAALSARLIVKNAETDLGYRNLWWIGLTLIKGGASTFESDTLPGEPAWVDGGAYYVEDREAAAQLINEKYNPYEKEIQADDLHPYGY